MRAIVEINGKQYEVEEGRYVRVDSYTAQENEEVVLGNVCMVIAGEQTLIGAPYVDGATVKTRVKRHGRGPKVLVYKMRCKKGYRRKNGHRQGFTELLVDVLDFPGRDKIAPMVKKAEEPAKTEKPQKSAEKAATVDAPEAPKTKKAPAKKAPAGEAKPAAKKKAAAPKAAKAPKPAKAEAPAEGGETSEKQADE